MLYKKGSFDFDLLYHVSTPDHFDETMCKINHMWYSFLRLGLIKFTQFAEIQWRGSILPFCCAKLFLALKECGSWTCFSLWNIRLNWKFCLIFQLFLFTIVLLHLSNMQKECFVTLSYKVLIKSLIQEYFLSQGHHQYLLPTQDYMTWNLTFWNAWPEPIFFNIFSFLNDLYY